MSESKQPILNELQQTLKSVNQLRYSASVSVILMLIGVAVVIGSFIYSINKLRPLEIQVAQIENQVAQKQSEIKDLEERIKELKKTTQALLPNGFTGKFGIPLETDAKLVDAKKNVFEKGKKYGFDSVYVFKMAGKDMCFDEGPECYRTVAVFDSWEQADKKKPLALKANPTADEIHPFDEFCPTPKWIDEGGYENSGYYDCLKK